MLAETCNARQNCEILPGHSPLGTKRPKGESSFRFDTEVHILQQTFTEIPTKSEVKTIMWNEPQEMGYSFFAFILQDKKSLPTVSGVLPLQFFSGHKEHSPFPLFQKSFLMGSETYHKQLAGLESRHCFVLSSHVRTGVYSPAQHFI